MSDRNGGWPIINYDNSPAGGPIIDPVELARRREAFALDVASTLARGETQYIGVFPVEENSYHFAYSVGRWGRGLPELLVTGMSARGEGFLRWIEEHWSDYPGPAVEWVLAGPVRAAIMLLELPRSIIDEHLTLARRIAGPEMTALQAVWTDDAGLWPWERESDPTLPVLGHLP